MIFELSSCISILKTFEPTKKTVDEKRACAMTIMRSVPTSYLEGAFIPYQKQEKKEGLLDLQQRDAFKTQ